MVKTNLTENVLIKVRNFIETIKDDQLYSTPLYTDEKISDTINKSQVREEYFLFTTMEGDSITGAYCFLIIDCEKYIESMFMYSRETRSYEEMLEYLKNMYTGYDAFFVYNPENKVFEDSLKNHQAHFYKEQRYMRYQGGHDFHADNRIIKYADKYREDYIKLHTNDGYWNGEKMLDALDRFHIFLAIEDEKLTGYIDLAYGNVENEIFDLYVSQKYRNKGIGRELIKQAIISNGTNELILTVDCDNAPALKIYTLLGFSDIKFNNLVTAEYRL